MGCAGSNEASPPIQSNPPAPETKKEEKAQSPQKDINK